MRRSHGADEDQDIDLPGLVDEGQRQGDGGADEVRGDQESAPGQPGGKGLGERCDKDIGDHLDAERRPEDGTGAITRDPECQKPEGDREQSGADQGNDLGGEQVSIGAMGEDAQHRVRLTGTSRGP